MGKLIYLAFEELPQRYTEMWNKAICKNLREGDIVVSGQSEKKKIEVGEFLDTYGTIIHKQWQIATIAELFQKKQIQDGDVFFVPDIFFPALESIRYMAELSDIKVKIATFNHAGRADKNDFVQKLKKWADVQEQAWHDMSDIVFVGSEYHKQNVQQKFNHSNVVVSGAVWDTEWMQEKCKDMDFTKEEYVIFPHRPCTEKRFAEFLKIVQLNPELKFVITSCGGKRLEDTVLPTNVTYMYNLTKKQYFQVFAKAKYYLSLALQETFGYTIQEAIFFGCKIIVADQPCYHEYVSNESIYPMSALMQKRFLTREYKKDNLCNSKQFESNAKKIINTIRQL